jgi:hypothetical protein
MLVPLRNGTTSRYDRGMAKVALDKETEWIGGIVPLPVYVMDGATAPYRPEALIWMTPDQVVLGMTAVDPKTLADIAVANFLETTQRPLVGRPRVPTRVRVAEDELASALRATLPPSTRVVCAPTPELDAVAPAIGEFFETTQPETDFSYLTPDVTPEAIAALFEAAARLYRVAPWELPLENAGTLIVSVDALDVREWVLVIMGELGESYGLALFRSREDHVAFAELGESMLVGEPPAAVPPQMSLSYEAAKDLPVPLRKEIAKHGWKIAGPRAYPQVVVVDGDLIGRPPARREALLFEALANGLAQLVEDEAKPLKASDHFSRTLSVRTHQGALEVTLETASDFPEHADDADGAALPIGELDILAAVRDADGSLEEDWFESFADAIMQRFADSPEGRDLAEDVHWAYTLMDYARSHHGVTVSELAPAELEDVIFEIFPRKISCLASAAHGIVAELRAFFAFLKREFALSNADSCLAVLGGDAEQRLARELANPDNYGMAKSMVMAGLREGFDVSSEEGLRTWFDTYNARLAAAASSRVAGEPKHLSADRHKAKKAKRKATRKSRRKNR